MTDSNGWVLWVRRGAVALGAAALLASPLAGGAGAAPAPVPVPKVALPPKIDWQAEYQGQKLCSDWAKPGAVKLSSLLRETYGEYTTYIIRSCATPGISEHEEGRAIDWMVDEEIPAQREKAEAFLDWVTAPGPNGELGAMARRMGIMYLIWDDKMWRVYRPEDGWQEYSGCSRKQSESYDTSCHRDHIHISLTWDGAYARTSFWTGTAETRGPCTPSARKRPSGSAADPVTLINTNTGKGLAAGDCRLGASDSYHGRTYKVTVPVPAGPDPVQRIRLDKFDLNAPESLRISSAETVTVAQKAKPGAVVDVPLNRDGVITFTVGAGYGRLLARGLGNDTSAAAAPEAEPRTPTKTVKVSDPDASDQESEPTQKAGRQKKTKSALLRLFAPEVDVVRVNTPMTMAGGVRRPPDGARVVLQRRKAGGEFATVVTADVTGRKYSLASPAVARPGTYEFRTVLATEKELVTLSTTSRQVVVKPAKVTLAKVSKARAKSRISLSGQVLGAPADAELKIRHRAPGKRWKIRKAKSVGNGEFTSVLRVATPGLGRVQVRLVGGGRIWDASVKRKARVIR